MSLFLGVSVRRLEKKLDQGHRRLRMDITAFRHVGTSLENKLYQSRSWLRVNATTCRHACTPTEKEAA